MIAIIDYGLGNLKSIKNALAELGEESIITNHYNEIQAADGLILPGVGAFGHAMTRINELNLDRSIKDFVTTGKPLLGICLGFQLLFTKSYEMGEFEGLGLLTGDVKKFPSSQNGKKVVVPNVGWNKILVNKEDDLIKFSAIQKSEDLKMYFVHSYFVPSNQPFTIATTQYKGLAFTSAIKKDNIYGVQFHPERSGPLGLEILRNFINITKELKNG